MLNSCFLWVVTHAHAARRFVDHHHSSTWMIHCKKSAQEVEVDLALIFIKTCFLKDALLRDGTTGLIGDACLWLTNESILFYKCEDHWSMLSLT